MRPIETLIRLLTMSCDGAASVASASLDDQPTPADKIALGLHTLCCPACRRFGRQMRFLRLAMARMKAKAPEADTPPGLLFPDCARHRIRAALEEASAPSSSVSPGAVSDRGGPID